MLTQMGSFLLIQHAPSSDGHIQFRDIVLLPFIADRWVTFVREGGDTCFRYLNHCLVLTGE